MWKDFREFISRGNVLDLAIAFILGAAFGRIVMSFVDDILMPPIGLVLGGVDFTNLFLSLNGVAYPSLAAAKEAGAPTINYGLFINSLVSFLILACALFIVVRAFQRLRRKEQGAAPAEPVTKPCPYCFSEIPHRATRCPDCPSDLTPELVSAREH